MPSETKPNFAYTGLCMCAAKTAEDALRCKFCSNVGGVCGYRGHHPTEPTCINTKANLEALCNDIKKYDIGTVLRLLTHDIVLENERWMNG